MEGEYISSINMAAGDIVDFINFNTNLASYTLGGHPGGWIYEAPGVRFSYMTGGLHWYADKMRLCQIKFYFEKCY